MFKVGERVRRVSHEFDELRIGDVREVCSAESGHIRLTGVDGLWNDSHFELVPDDPVNHPTHYTSHESGVECITVTEHMSFCLGNVFKYLWRSGKKGPALEDMKKARWYLDREIQRLFPEESKP